eukprot:m51a1_g3499 hypothetical protein (590) ;mRNA; r:830277-832446
MQDEGGPRADLGLDLGVLCQAVVREYLSSKGFKSTLQAFNSEQPKDADSIRNRKVLASKLRIEPLVKRNTQREKPLDATLEIIIDYLVSRPSTSASHSASARLRTLTRPPALPVSPLAQSAGSGEQQSQQRPASPTAPLSPAPSVSPSAAAPVAPGQQPPRQARPPSALCRQRLLRVQPAPGSGSDDKGDSPSPHSSSSGSPPLQSGYRIRSAKDRDGEQTTQVTPKTSKRGLLEDCGGPTETNAPTSSKRIPQEQAAALNALVFTRRKLFAEEWHQGFFFCNTQDMRFGLVQSKGGPCGVIAPVQAFVVRELLASGGCDEDPGKLLNPTDEARTRALVRALTEILWMAGDRRRAVVVLSPTTPQAYEVYRLTDWTVYEFRSYDATLTFIGDHLHCFSEKGGNGVILFLYSAILSRGIEEVRKDMDFPEATTLQASHGYCSQEIVNLLMVGKARSNVFDGVIQVEQGTLRGIDKRAEVGFLALVEAYGSLVVGQNLKSPVNPIWVVYSESHFTVLFAKDDSPLKEPIFDVYYYDQLANSDELYRLTINTQKKRVPTPQGRKDLTPPIELCIRTRWPEADIDWNGSDPLL